MDRTGSRRPRGTSGSAGGTFPDDAEVVSLYDAGDGKFGYTLNLGWPDGSEWGYCWFPGVEEDAA